MRTLQTSMVRDNIPDICGADNKFEPCVQRSFTKLILVFYIYIYIYLYMSMGREADGKEEKHHMKLTEKTEGSICCDMKTITLKKARVSAGLRSLWTVIYETPCLILPELKEIGCCVFTVNKWQCIKEIHNPSNSHQNGKKLQNSNLGMMFQLRKGKTVCFG